MELVTVLIVAMIVVGPRRLPEIARTMGEMVRTVKRASAELSRTVTEEIDSEFRESKNDITEISREVESTLKDSIENPSNNEDTSKN